MNDLNYKSLFSTVPTLVFLVACASTDRNTDRNYPSANTASGSVAEYVVTENYDLDLIEYTVKPGDRLSDIAREVTGVSSNWREIAEFNAITPK